MLIKVSIRLVKESLMFNKHLGREVHQYIFGFHSITNKKFYKHFFKKSDKYYNNFRKHKKNIN